MNGATIERITVKIVCLFGDVRKQTPIPESPTPPCCLNFHGEGMMLPSSLNIVRSVLNGIGLPGLFLQTRLRIERINVRQPAREVAEDDVLRPAPEDSPSGLDPQANRSTPACRIRPTSSATSRVSKGALIRVLGQI